MSEDVNPFEPPKKDWVRPAERADERVDHFVDATRSARFANYMIDTLVMLAVLFTMGEDFYLVTFFAYYLFFESIFGKTPGKWITGTKVISKSGRRPRFMQILGRTLTRWIPFEPLTFFGRKGRGWHDAWSGTRVVQDRERRRRRRRRRH
jgi:uncharacterized RDD family membrane protein YckC